ncbi:MAG: enoyl-CoA hydratase-related protein [Chloroflexota bacterium]
MAYQTILFERSEGVGTVTLNRPDQLNAFTLQMLQELLDVFKGMERDPEVRAIIITGAGKAFCGGEDFKSRAEAELTVQPPPPTTNPYPYGNSPQPLFSNPYNSDTPIRTNDPYNSDPLRTTDPYNSDPPRTTDPYNIDPPLRTADPYNSDTPIRTNDPYNSDTPRTTDPYNIDPPIRTTDPYNIDPPIRTNDPYNIDPQPLTSNLYFSDPQPPPAPYNPNSTDSYAVQPVSAFGPSPSYSPLNPGPPPSFSGTIFEEPPSPYDNLFNPRPVPSPSSPTPLPNNPLAAFTPPPVNAPRPLEMAEQIRRAYNPLIKQIRAIEKPVIAAVNGVAAGTGLGLALACDIRYANERTRFVEVSIRVGLLPGGGNAFFLPRLIGLSQALELAFSGDELGATEAERLGLVNRIVPSEQLMEQTRKFAVRLAKGPTRAIGLTKSLVYSSTNLTLDQALEQEARLMEETSQTKDYKEGLRSFLEKRPPKYRGE